MNILASETVEAHFLTMLHEARVDIDRPNVRQVWNVFKNFAQLPVDCPAEICVESFLLECGCYIFSREVFTFHFSRSFHIVNKGAAWTEMLDCDFDFKLDDELKNLEVYIAKFADHYEHSSQALDDFIQEVEEKTEFWKIIAKHQPTHTFIGCQGL